MLSKWDKRFLRLAAHVAQWSKDPSTKVGAVIVNPNRIVVGLGYNGFPRGVHDLPSRLNDRQEKYALMIHAEVNAILNANANVAGCTLYTWPLAPCSDCSVFIAQAGIKRVVAPEPSDDIIMRWGDSLLTSERCFIECNVQLDIEGQADDFKGD